MDFTLREWLLVIGAVLIVGYCMIGAGMNIAPVGVVSPKYLIPAVNESIRLCKPEKDQKLTQSGRSHENDGGLAKDNSSGEGDHEGICVGENTCIHQS